MKGIACNMITLLQKINPMILVFFSQCCGPEEAEASSHLKKQIHGKAC
jgi:hypothetical protein